MQKVTFIFKKIGYMKYISHLDLMRLFMRAMRRAGLPIKITEGFSPHIKLSIKRAIKLGLESGQEEATVHLKKEISSIEFKGRLNQQLPEGVEVVDVQRNFN